MKEPHGNKAHKSLIDEVWNFDPPNERSEKDVITYF